MISTRGRYALRIMVELAEQPAGQYIPLGVLAERQGISPGYLARIMAELSKAGLVDGLQGKGGGYRLTRSADSYSIGEILRASDEDMAPVSCLEADAEPCERQEECRTFDLWVRLDGLIRGFLDSVTLNELARRTF